VSEQLRCNEPSGCDAAAAQSCAISLKQLRVEPTAEPEQNSRLPAGLLAPATMLLSAASREGVCMRLCRRA